MQILDRVYLVGSGSVGISHLFDCHVYLIDGGSELALVDAGSGLETDRILENIAAEGFDPSRIGRILVTHAHEDHAGGVARFVEAYGCKVAASSEEARLMRESSNHGKSMGGRPQSDADIKSFPFDVSTVADGELLALGDLRVRAIVVPGHSVASVCYLVEADGRLCLFSGDTVFINGLVGILNSPGCDIGAYRRSIGKLSGLGVEALLPGHHLFTIDGGQRHIDRAVKSFAETRLPPYIGMMGSNRG